MTWQFGEKLRAVRQHRGLSQTELARLVGIVSQSHLAKIEADQDPPSLPVVLQLAATLDVSLDYLFQEIPSAAQSDQPPTGLTGPLSLAAFGPRLRALRLSHGLSQGDLADRLGLARRGHISNLETGRKQPSIELLLLTAEQFQVTLDQLLAEAPA